MHQAFCPPRQELARCGMKFPWVTKSRRGDLGQSSPCVSSEKIRLEPRVIASFLWWNLSCGACLHACSSSSAATQPLEYAEATPYLNVAWRELNGVKIPITSVANKMRVMIISFRVRLVGYLPRFKEMIQNKCYRCVTARSFFCPFSFLLEENCLIHR